MNKYTTLLQKYLKIGVFLLLVMSLFVGFGILFRTSSNIESAAARDPETYKAAFFQAMQAQDLEKGREALEKLETLLPANDLFITEVAPAYMGDLYVKYAKVLQYSPQAAELMLEQAQHWVPDHPELHALEKTLSEATLPPVMAAEPEPEPTQLAESAEAEVETELYIEPDPVIALDQEHPLHIEKVSPPVTLSLAALEPDAPESDGPPRIPYIDPPPLVGFYPEPERELLEAPEVVAVSDAKEPMTSDPCALSYLTKTQALTPCIDPVGGSRFGPALFVVEDTQKNALLAFTQQAITRQDYQLFCDATGACYEEVEEEKPLIDLTDVEETLHDYNAYCQMSGACEKINAQPKASKVLTRGQAQRYALWLSQTTGYKYRHPKQEDAEAIQAYFKTCVEAKNCSPEILQTVAGLMEESDRVLVREVE